MNASADDVFKNLPMPTPVLAKKKKNEGHEVIDVDAVQSNIFDTIPDSAILSIDDPVTEKTVVKNPYKRIKITKNPYKN